MGIPVVVFTSDKYSWALGPFCHLFDTYWSSLQPVTVVGFNRPSFPLPSNFEFYSVAPQNYPPERWSDAVIQYLSGQDFSHFCLFLEDYWLMRGVDHAGITSLMVYTREHPEVLRMDLTADRLYAGGMYDVEPWGHYDIIETPPSTPYQMSTQAGIWNRELLLKLLKHNKTAWEVEIQTQVPPEMRILGTRQYPIRYANGILKGKLDVGQIQMIPQPHRSHISQWFPKDIETT
jgi:hypothetical protein